MLAVLSAVTLVLPIANQVGQLLPQELTLIALVYRCETQVLAGVGAGAPGETVVVPVDSEYGCWYAKAQYATTGLISAPSESTSKRRSRPPCLFCHGG